MKTKIKILNSEPIFIGKWWKSKSDIEEDFNSKYNTEATQKTNFNNKIILLAGLETVCHVSYEKGGFGYLLYYEDGNFYESEIRFLRYHTIGDFKSTKLTMKDLKEVGMGRKANDSYYREHLITLLGLEKELKIKELKETEYKVKQGYLIRRHGISYGNWNY